MKQRIIKFIGWDKIDKEIKFALIIYFLMGLTFGFIGGCLFGL